MEMLVSSKVVQLLEKVSRIRAIVSGSSSPATSTVAVLRSSRIVGNSGSATFGAHFQNDGWWTTKKTQERQIVASRY
ncbi:unnamed protein product [Acanthoscelides obtectus]|uniref:Uncharacterized protein n=1 Tax=Acanthoscelides obtectus TaxID=200917 RepID=A0A9P0K379_ACAOB|nr:unnamed protein product [Acanthoscelides obtectus]CAK1634227.1 hypothetical protein AOBTE_LOCUS8679 [Acanthoscelides obtectus]